MKETRPNRFGPLVAGLVLLHLVKAFLFLAAGEPPFYRDSYVYWWLGGKVAAGDPWMREAAIAYRTPLYPWFLGMVRGLVPGGALVATAALQQLAAVLAGGLAAWAAWRVTGRRIALIFGLGLALFAVSRHSVANHVWSDNLFALAVAAFLAAFAWWHEAPSVRRALVLGFALGLGTLARPLLQWAFVPVLVAAALSLSRIERGARRRAWLSQSAALFGAFVLVLSPWLLRNREVFGEAFLVRFDGRLLYWSAFGQGAELPFPESVGGDAASLERRPWPTYAALLRSGLSEPAADRQMEVVAHAAIEAHTGTYARATLQRFLAFWFSPVVVPRAHTEPELLGRPPPDVRRPGDTPHRIDQTYAGETPWRHEPSARVHDALVGVALGPAQPVLYPVLIALSWLPLGLLVVGVRTRPFGVGLVLFVLLVATLTSVAPDTAYRYRMVVEPVYLCAWAAALASLRAPGQDQELGSEGEPA